jgi:RHS repeat-associated protein
MSSDGNGTSFSYDGHDRMSAAGTSTYQYDALDRQRTSNGTAINYDGFSQTPAIETVSGSDRIYALDPYGMPKAVQSGAGAEYLTDDGHGNIGSKTSASQSVTCSTQYDPWGAPPRGQASPCSGGSGTQDDLFYRSFRRDVANGTYQFGSRIYDPTKAGFLASDVYRTGSPSLNQGLQLDPLTQDRYNYVNGNPVNLVDFDGHKVCAQGDPNPDCDAYRQGTTYRGWKDQAYYDHQEQQRARDNQEAAVRYHQWQQQQKREAEKKKSQCSWNPFDQNSCEARGVGAALDATAQCFGGPEHTCLKIAAEVASASQSALPARP